MHNIDSTKPSIRYTARGKREELTCDLIAGCDAFHGICRPAPGDAVRFYDKTYPFDWLGILAEAPPSSEALVYTYHECGFALFSMSSQKISRLYFQVPPDEDINQWPDAAIWVQMLKRMTTRDGWSPNVGPILNKNVTAMRSFVTEPMRFGRLYLAGDAAHIVPPTGAKGLISRPPTCSIWAGPSLRSTAVARWICSVNTPIRRSNGSGCAALIVVDNPDVAPVSRWKSV